MIEHLIRVAEADALDHLFRIAEIVGSSARSSRLVFFHMNFLRIARRRAWELANDLARRFIFPDPLERGMPQDPVAGPFSEFHLGDELGPHPMNLSQP